jgi:hypothetical protein
MDAEYVIHVQLNVGIVFEAIVGADHCLHPNVRIGLARLVSQHSHTVSQMSTERRASALQSVKGSN